MLFAAHDDGVSLSTMHAQPLSSPRPSPPPHLHPAHMAVQELYVPIEKWGPISITKLSHKAMLPAAKKCAALAKQLSGDATDEEKSKALFALRTLFTDFLVGGATAHTVGLVWSVQAPVTSRIGSILFAWWGTLTITCLSLPPSTLHSPPHPLTAQVTYEEHSKYEEDIVFPHFNFIFPGVADQVLAIHSHPKPARESLRATHTLQPLTLATAVAASVACDDV